MSQNAFAIDLITFFHPSYWGVEDEAAVIALGHASPRAFWDRLLDGVAQSGAKGIELTFSPFGWRDTLAAYGSAEAFRAQLDQRGLQLATGFFADVAVQGDLLNPERQAAHLAEGEAYAAYLASFGGEVMVMGLPMRQSWNSTPAPILGLNEASAMADFCNRLGAVTLRHGVKLALHTEAHSVFSLARDIDLFMLLTDPVFVNFCPDSAHILLGGADPVDVVSRHVERVVATHWKDATGPAPIRVPIDHLIHTQHRPFFCALGQGKVDWPRWRAMLERAGFAGWNIVEIDATANPVGEVQASLAFLDAEIIPVLG
ncbi:sugar phosphate isomerase/epimerase [Novosphingobium umbonatum]|uniref:Sugar phosphate isomerase/epimerase n=1 Tax=Novosphingobium umbonatum TaxID=1908524 RepID=A0A3S2X6L0_9SPHN|nr:sugar phosphate isomerase/epimerase [Novosphingobium umbonatum]RVU06957.1 sugar phosphate isomerase/epimerase [Novosphingobium umbonatum]